MTTQIAVSPPSPPISAPPPPPQPAPPSMSHIVNSSRKRSLKSSSSSSLSTTSTPHHASLGSRSNSKRKQAHPTPMSIASPNNHNPMQVCYLISLLCGANFFGKRFFPQIPLPLSTFCCIYSWVRGLSNLSCPGGAAVQCAAPIRNRGVLCRLV